MVSAEAYCNEFLDFGYVLLLLVWSMAEVIRYPFYISKLLGVGWGAIEWLRYNAFLVLYPIGFGAEMRCWWGLMKLLMRKGNQSDPEVNYVVSGVSLRGWAMFTFALTPCVGSYMYYGMLVARRKFLRSARKKRD